MSTVNVLDEFDRVAEHLDGLMASGGGASHADLEQLAFILRGARSNIQESNPEMKPTRAVPDPSIAKHGPGYVDPNTGARVPLEAQPDKLSGPVDPNRGQAIPPTVTPSLVSFSAIVGQGNPPPQPINIGGSRPWSAGKSQGWLSLHPLSGMAPGILELSVNVGELAAGNYSDTVVINMPNSAPLHVSVSLVVTQ